MSNKNYTCETCGQKLADCAGHFGGWGGKAWELQLGGWGTGALRWVAGLGAASLEVSWLVEWNRRQGMSRWCTRAGRLNKWIVTLCTACDRAARCGD